MSESGQLFEKIVRGSVLIFVGNVLGVGALFATRLIAARYLTPGPYGALVLGITLLNLLAFICLLGLDRGLGRQLPRTSDATGLASATVYVPVVIAALIAIVAVPLADLLAAVFDEPQLGTVFRIFIVALPFFVLVRISFGIFQGFEDSLGKVLAQNFFYQGLVLFAVGVSIGLGTNITGLSIAWAGSLVVSAFASLLLLFWRIEGASLGQLVATTPLKKPDAVGSLVVFSVPLMVSGLVYQLLIQTDNLLIGYFLTSDAVGLYDASFTLGMSLHLLINAFTFLSVPVLSSLHAEDRFELMDRLYKLVAKWMVFLALPIYILLVTNPVEIVTLVFGDAYGQASGLVLVIVASGFFVKLTLGLNSPTLTAAGYPRLVMLSDLLALAINVSLNLALIPQMGIIGAAIASFTALAAGNVIRSAFLYWQTGIQPLYTRSVIPVLVSAPLLVSVHVAISESISNVVALLALFTVVHLAVIVLVGGVEREDTELLTTVRSNR